MAQHFVTQHEAVTYCFDPHSGLKAIIAIHSTRFGPALGGTRIFPYGGDDDALKDVLELSQAMSYKAAAADLPFGGGKAVMITSPEDPQKRTKLQAFSKFINLFGGSFQTGEDLGTTQEDIQFLRQFTPFAHCTASELPDWLETSALTARGVLRGIEASLKHRFGSAALSGRTVAIQGLGKVGMNLARYLAENGARLVVSDVRPQLAEQAAAELKCATAKPDTILAVDADVFSPCAIGRILTPESVHQLRASIVAGCANNQLSDDSVGGLLRNRNILYAPDYVINSGGLISALLEMGIEDEKQMVERVDAIGDRLLRIYSKADEERVSTVDVINNIVRAKLGSHHEDTK